MSLQSLPPSSPSLLLSVSPVSISIFPSSYNDVNHWIRTTLIEYCINVTWLYQQITIFGNSYFQICSYSLLPTIRTWKHIWGDTILSIVSCDTVSLLLMCFPLLHLALVYQGFFAFLWLTSCSLSSSWWPSSSKNLSQSLLTVL
jgi:hypothetical protein